MTGRATMPVGLGILLLVLTGTADGQTLGPPQSFYVQAPQGDWNQKPPMEGPPTGSTPLAPALACTPACDHGGCFAWAGVYCLQPITLANKFTALTINTQNSSGTTLSSQGVEFDYNFEAAPQIVVGYLFQDGLAFRSRYWHFEESVHHDVTSPGPAAGNEATVFLSPGGPFQTPFIAVPSGNTLFTSDRLQVDVLDLELTQEVCICRCSLVYTGGLRLARIRQSYSAQAEITTGETPEGESLNSADTSEGIGPTISYEFRRKLGCGLSLFHSSRVAVLFGHEKLEGATTGTGFAFGTDAIQVSSSRMEFIPMGELEVGVEWAADIHRWHLTAQATGVGMAYGSLGLGGFHMQVGVQY
jgi:Legionella pneumophila major outer membrane protein precursor